MEDAKAKGASILTGGRRPSLQGSTAGGYFFEPTVIGDAAPEMQIYKEETFGPAIPVFKFKDDLDAIAMANDTEYGLAAYFYTKVSHSLDESVRLSQLHCSNFLGCQTWLAIVSC